MWFWVIAAPIVFAVVVKFKLTKLLKAGGATIMFGRHGIGKKDGEIMLNNIVGGEPVYRPIRALVIDSERQLKTNIRGNRLQNETVS